MTSAGRDIRSSNGTVAIFPWGNCIEDFLDAIGVSLNVFCQEMTGGWLFGYMSALRLAGLNPVLYCYSRSITAVERRWHLPTACTINLLPLPSLYRVMSRHMTHPYAACAKDAFAESGGMLIRPLAKLAYELAPYCAIARSTLSKVLREDDCQFILVQEYEDPRFDRIVDVGRRLKIPVFATFQGGDRHFRWIEHFSRPRAIARSAGLIIGSASERDRVIHQYGPRCQIIDIPNPIDLNLWYPEAKQAARGLLGWSHRERIAIYHGRIDIHRKGLDVLIAAWTRVCSLMRDAPIRLVVIGDGPDKEAFGGLIRTSGSDKISWTPSYILDRNLMRRTLSAADVGVTATRHEGFPVAPIEAMACGLPIVASDAPGIPEILSDGRAGGGILFSRGDVEALAAALVELLSQPQKSADYGQLARKTVEQRFGLGIVGERLADALASKV